MHFVFYSPLPSFYLYFLFFIFWQQLISVLPIQAEAATQFLTIMRHYLESLCVNLRSHTITSVQSDDRVGASILIIYVVHPVSFLTNHCTTARSFSASFMCLINFQVSLLLKDSFIDSFPSKDRPFIKVICVLYFSGSHLLVFTQSKLIVATC